MVAAVDVVADVSVAVVSVAAVVVDVASCGHASAAAKTNDRIKRIRRAADMDVLSFCR
jgi:hypothetical protein